MDLYNKAKWVLGITVVFVIIIATNLIDRNNFLRVRDSVTAIYEDRLVAKDLIFDLTRHLHEIELAIIQTDTAFFLQRNEQVNSSIQDLLVRYEQTKVTTEEGKILQIMKENLASLKQMETDYIASNFIKRAGLPTQISMLKENLDFLSNIQLKEGKRQVSISNRAIDSVELFTHLEIYVLIFLAVVIQIIVIYKPKEEKEE